MTPSAAASRSADGMTSAGFLPPISVMQGLGNSRLKRPRSDIPTAFDPVKSMPSTRRVQGEGLARGFAGAEHEMKGARGDPGLPEDPVEREGGERRLLAGLEHDGVAGEERAPRPAPPRGRPGKLKGLITAHTP